jgi:dCTP deaminase
MLSNQGILKAMENGSIEITPFNEELLGSCSYDITLGEIFHRIPRTSRHLDLCEFEEDYSSRYDMKTTSDKMVVMPGEAILAITREEVYVGPQHAAEVRGKSSLGRLFQLVHVTAGWVDAGFRGYITLELVNLMPRPVVYTAGQRIGQLTFVELDSPADPVYDMKGQYSNNLNEPIPAKKVKRG